MYIEQILPAICEAGEDRHYGSCASGDIIALQAISKRVHYGKQVRCRNGRAAVAAHRNSALKLPLPHCFAIVRLLRSSFASSGRSTPS
jgi:hypothetical protein